MSVSPFAEPVRPEALQPEALHADAVNIDALHADARNGRALSIAVVVGHPKPQSRTLTAASVLATELASRWSATPLPQIINLAGIARNLVGHPSVDLANINDMVGSSNVVIVGTPVFKASYTGLLKLFLDQLRTGALAGAVAVPVTLAAAPAHRFAADLQLRPVLAELGAGLAVPSLTLEERELGELPQHVSAWADRHAAVVGAASSSLRKPKTVV